MKRRTFIQGFGAIFAGGLALGGAYAWFIKATGHTEALLTDPEMQEFTYSDGWIIPVEK